jgi:hypothetical protein
VVISAQPALAAADMAGIFAVPAPNEIAMVAVTEGRGKGIGEDYGNYNGNDNASADQKASAKAMAKAEFQEFLNKKGLAAEFAGPAKKNLSSGAGFSLPSLPSLPNNPFGGGAKEAAPAAKGAAAPASTYSEGSSILIPALLVLFSPLLIVAAISLQTLIRVVPQAAGGKDFFPKDNIPF